MIWQDTFEKYIGQWLDNFQNGMGIHIWYETKGEQKYLRNRYVGEWRNGFRHGYGVFFYANGGKYEGMWEQNYKNGYGVFTFHDGSQYAGFFTMDRMDYNNIGYLPGENITKSSIINNTNISNKLAGNKQIGKAKELKVIKDEDEDYNNNGKKNLKEIKEKEKNEEKDKRNDENNEKKILKKQTGEIGKVEQKTGTSEQNQVQGSIKKVENKEKSMDIIANKKTNTINESGKKVLEKNQENKSTNLKINDQGKSDNTDNTKTTTRKENIKSEKNSDKKLNDLQDTNPSKAVNNKQSDNPKSDRKSERSENISNTIQSKTNIKRATDSIDSNQNRNSNLNADIPKLDSEKKSQNESRTVFAYKTVKESEQNPFKTLLDITDIIETETEIDSCLRDVENILLRYLSEIKAWYRFYTNKDTNNNDDMSSHKENQNLKLNNPSSELKETENILDNNDIGFAMEMRDLWKFMRDSNLLSIDFSLAGYNRIYFRGPKNYIEMYLCPDEIKLYSKEYYDYIYTMIQKSREDFMYKNRDKFLNSSNNVSNQSQEFSNLLFKPSEIESNVDIHYKKNIVLLRQFFESIVRMAYLKYFQSSEPLHKKIKMLIDDYIKTNPNLKRNAKKSNTHDSSLNSTLILDMKAKIFEYSFDIFIREYDSKLKKIFQNLFLKTTNSFKKSDITITYRFFFDNLIKKSEMFKSLFDKFKFIEVMTVYHKDKNKITEENKHSNEVSIYIESLFDCEIIFYEFCELVFFVCRKYFSEHSIHEKKEKEAFSEILNHFINVSSKADSLYNLTERYVYYYPKLPNHKKYEALIEADKQKRMQEEKRRMDLKRLEMERNLMSLEDANILPHNEIDEEEEDMSDNLVEGD